MIIKTAPPFPLQCEKSERFLSCKFKKIHQEDRKKIESFSSRFLPSVIAIFLQVFAVNYYLSLGVPKEKLIMGIPEYGRCYTLDNINENGLLSPASKPGPAGPYIRIPGTLGFNEVTPLFSIVLSSLKSFLPQPDLGR